MNNRCGNFYRKWGSLNRVEWEDKYFMLKEDFCLKCLMKKKKIHLNLNN